MYTDAWGSVPSAWLAVFAVAVLQAAVCLKMAALGRKNKRITCGDKIATGICDKVANHHALCTEIILLERTVQRQALLPNHCDGEDP
jgi:hypothetical protein